MAAVARSRPLSLPGRGKASNLDLAGDSRKAGNGREPRPCWQRTGLLPGADHGRAAPLRLHSISPHMNRTQERVPQCRGYASLSYALAEDGLVRIVPRWG